MASVRIERVVDAPAEQVWEAIRDLGALHTRLVPGFVIDTVLEDGARRVTFGNGMVVREVVAISTTPVAASPTASGPRASNTTMRRTRSSPMARDGAASYGPRTFCPTASRRRSAR